MHLCDNPERYLDEAVATLNSIPSRSRSAKMNLLLGQLHLRRGFERSAISCFKDVLKVLADTVHRPPCMVVAPIGMEDCFCDSRNIPCAWRQQKA